MDLETMLRRCGLPKHSGTVFAHIEMHEPASATALADATALHRPALYRALVALESHQLIYTRSYGKRKNYFAHDRSRIGALFSREQTQVAATVKKIQPQRHKKSASDVQHLTGTMGITAVFDDVLQHSKRGETFYRYTSEQELDEVNAYLPRDYRARRDRKRLERMVISNPESGSRKRKRLERFIKFLGDPKEAFRHNAIQLIYGSRIAFIDLNSTRSIIINNETLAQFQKTIFRALYRRL